MVGAGASEFFVPVQVNRSIRLPFDLGASRVAFFQSFHRKLGARQFALLHAHQISQTCILDHQRTVLERLADRQGEIVIVPGLADEAIDFGAVDGAR